MRTSPMLFRRCTVTYQWYYWHSIFSNDLKNPSYNNSECVRINRYLLYMWTMTFQGRVSKTCRHKYVSKEMQPPSIVLQCTQNNNQRIQCINWSRVLDIRSSKQLSSCSVHGVTQLLSSGARLIPVGGANSNLKPSLQVWLRSAESSEYGTLGLKKMQRTLRKLGRDKV